MLEKKRESEREREREGPRREHVTCVVNSLTLTTRCLPSKVTRLLRKRLPRVSLHAPKIRAGAAIIVCLLVRPFYPHCLFAQHESTATIYVVLVVKTRRARERKSKRARESESERE